MATKTKPAIATDNVVQFPVGRRTGQFDRDALIDALNDNRVGLDYQPQYSLITGELLGAEALLRLRNDQGTVQDAAAVVSVAEQEGLIDWLGSQVRETACREFAALADEYTGRLPCRLAINVSPLELRQADFAEEVAQAIEDSGLKFDDVELEITESATLNDPSLLLGNLYTLDEMGVRLAIDDFGSGHTAWSSVLRLPISTLKIDRALISQALDSRRAAIVVRHICATSAELGMQVIAEGVSDARHQALLRQLGCHLGQGYGLARPMPADGLLDKAIIAQA